MSAAPSSSLWKSAEPHHGYGHIGRLNPRGNRGRVKGRHEDPRPDVELADETDKVRRSAMWSPKHRANDCKICGGSGYMCPHCADGTCGCAKCQPRDLLAVDTDGATT